MKWWILTVGVIFLLSVGNYITNIQQPKLYEILQNGSPARLYVDSRNLTNSKLELQLMNSGLKVANIFIDKKFAQECGVSQSATDYKCMQQVKAQWTTDNSGSKLTLYNDECGIDFICTLNQ